MSLPELIDADRDGLEGRSRALARPIYLGGDTALTFVLGRYKFYLDTRDIGLVSHLLMDGCWESWLTLFLARRIRTGMGVVDIGANHGYYTVLFADLVGSGGRVAAVEPNPHLCKLLRQTLSINGLDSRVDVLEQAAMDRNAMVTMHIVPEESKNGWVISTEAAFLPGATVVPGRALADDLLSWDRVDFIKLDAEGSEERAISGLWPVLERDRPDMLLEFRARRCSDPAGLIDRLNALYGAIRYIDTDSELYPIDLDLVLDRAREEDWNLFLSAAGEQTR